MKIRNRSGMPAGLMFLLFLLAAPLPSLSAPDVSPDAPALKEKLATSPLQVRSSEEDGLLAAEISGTIEYPFSRVKEALTAPAAWCEFLPVVFNIKSCIYSIRDDRTLLTLFIGRKFFDPPDEAIQLEYVFRVLGQEEDRSRVLLTAAEGPHGTRDYRIEVEALADSEGRTRLRFYSSFRPSLRSTFETRLYLATSGSDKVGFSVARQEGDTPVYVGGTKGIIERNAMRYYLALKAYLDTIEIAEENRFAARLNTWFNLTQKFPRQLYEMDRPEYLSTKRKERRYQLELQGNTHRNKAFRANRGIDAGRDDRGTSLRSHRRSHGELKRG